MLPVEETGASTWLLDKSKWCSWRVCSGILTYPGNLTFQTSLYTKCFNCVRFSFDAIFDLLYVNTLLDLYTEFLPTERGYSEACFIF